MFRLTGQLRGPGHASCKELSVVTQDGPARRLRFRLKPIKHDFGRVLCMADAKTLRRAADEVLRETGSGTRQRVLPQEWTLHQDDMGARAAAKSQAFWTVFSKRFKASVPILSAADTVHVLRAFHALNKDTGVYVAAAPTIRGKVQELDKRSLLDGLHILSRRLKTNTQQQLFRAMADQVPNVLWQMSAADVGATLWHLSRARCVDGRLAAYMHQKFCDSTETLTDIELGTSALAFARHGHTREQLFEAVVAAISPECSGEALFRAAWGLHIAGLDVASLLRARLATCLAHVKNTEGRVTEIWRRILRDTEFYHEAFGARHPRC